MTAALAVVVPVFALIALGYVFAVRGWFSAATGKVLPEFCFSLAVPAMLFRSTATADIPFDSAFAVWASFFFAIFANWALAASIARVVGRTRQEGAAFAVASCYGNVVMLGVPLATTAFGPAAATTIAILLSTHTAIQWLLGSVHLALTGGAGEGSLHAALRTVLLDIAKNPIVLSVVGGTLWGMGGIGLAPIVDRVLGLLAEAAIPTALFALGFGLADFRIAGQARTLVGILILKNAVMPAIAAALALAVFRLDPASAGVVVLFAAMPTGAMAFLFAAKYGQVVNSTSGAVALGTALSVFTAAGILWAFGG